MRWKRLSRLRLFALLLAILLAVAACGGGDEESPEEGAPAGEEPGESLKIASINTQRVTAGDWDPAGFQAFEGMASILTDAGFEVETSVSENTGYDVAPQVFRDFANQDYDIVVAHSSGYEPAVLEVAPDFPETWFLVFSDLSTTKDLPNVAGWKVGWTQLGYVQGATACLASSTKTIGLVNSVPIPAFTKTAGGAQKAAADYCGSEDDLLITWIDSFTDVAKAKDAALALESQGADVIFDAADTAGQGVFEAAKEGDFKVIGKYIDQSDLAPTVVTSVLIDFDAAYAEMADLFASGDLEPKIYDVIVQKDAIGVTTPFKGVDPKVEQQIVDLIEQIKSGELVIDPDLEVLP